jgi:hypothetical protein
MMSQDPQEQLAELYVAEFLRAKGLTIESVRELPAGRAHQIMVDASTYAALKLAEVEKKSQMARELSGGSGDE